MTKVIAELEAGQSVALVSDAGTPLVSDPGYRLLRAAHRHGITVSPMPGASAVTAALSAAGLPTDRFCFEGFLPGQGSGATRARLQSLTSETRTLVFFESVHRIAAALADLGEVFGEDRDAFIGRELSKLHEQCVQGSLGSLRLKVDAGVIVNKGEFVIVVAGADLEAESTLDTDTLLVELAKHLPGKDAAKVTAQANG